MSKAKKDVAVKDRDQINVRISEKQLRLILEPMSREGLIDLVVDLMKLRYKEG